MVGANVARKFHKEIQLDPITCSVTTLLTAVFHAQQPAVDTYIDPGSGSFLFQLLIASILGGLFLLKSFWGRIKAFFRRLFSTRKEDHTDVK